MADHHEVVFESEICAYLQARGWLSSANDTGYDRERALFPEDLFAWLEETQNAAYEKALKAAGSQAKFLDVLTSALDRPVYPVRVVGERLEVALPPSASTAPG